MAQDYQTLVDLFGPGTGAMMAGEQYQLGQDAAVMQQRQRMQELQDAQAKAAHTAQMNPLLVAHQQATNAGQADTNRKLAVDAALAEGTKADKLATSTLDLRQKQREDAVAKMSTMAQQLNSLVPQLPMYGAAAPAAVRDILIQNGMNPQDPKDSQFIQGMMKLPPQKMAEALTKFQNHLITTSDKYVTQMAKEKEDTNRAYGVARINAQSRETVAASKGSQSVQNIQDAVRTGKMSFEKAAAAFYGAAMFEQDEALRAKYLKLSEDMERANLAAKTAGGANKLDITAATNLPTVPLKPALGGGPTLGTPENPIDLRPTKK